MSRLAWWLLAFLHSVNSFSSFQNINFLFAYLEIESCGKIKIPCGGRGECTDQPNGIMCRCDKGYIGQNCNNSE